MRPTQFFYVYVALTLAAAKAIATEYPNEVPGHWDLTGAQVIERMLTRLLFSGLPLVLVAVVVRYALRTCGATMRTWLWSGLSYVLGAILFASIALPTYRDARDPRSVGLLYGMVFGFTLGMIVMGTPVIALMRIRLTSRRLSRRGFDVLPRNGNSKDAIGGERVGDHLKGEEGQPS